MPGFFLQPVDLASLALLFVALLKGWRLWRLRPATAASRWLALAALCGGLFALFSMLVSIRLDAWSFYALHLRVVSIAVGALAIVQFTYTVGDLDPSGKEARRALIASLLTTAYIAGWAGYQVLHFSATGEMAFGLLPSRLLLGGWIIWALIVTARQARQARRDGRLEPPVSYLLILMLSELLFLVANLISVISGANGGTLANDILPIYLVSLAVILISFNFLLYADTEHSRFNRLVAVSLLALQSVFTLLAALFEWQIAASLPAVSSDAGAAFYTYRAAVNGWIEPLFLFQSLVSLFSIGLLTFLEGYLRAQDQRRITQTLNDRQVDIARLVAAGKSNADIAKELHITEATVKYHLTHIFQTLNLTSRKSLTAWYREIAEK